jgi:hypothetical protein
MNVNYKFKRSEKKRKTMQIAIIIIIIIIGVGWSFVSIWRRRKRIGFIIDFRIKKLIDFSSKSRSCTQKMSIKWPVLGREFASFLLCKRKTGFAQSLFYCLVGCEPFCECSFSFCILFCTPANAIQSAALRATIAEMGWMDTDFQDTFLSIVVLTNSPTISSQTLCGRDNKGCKPFGNENWPESNHCTLDDPFEHNIDLFSIQKTMEISLIFTDGPRSSDYHISLFRLHFVFLFFFWFVATIFFPLSPSASFCCNVLQHTYVARLMQLASFWFSWISNSGGFHGTNRWWIEWIQLWRTGRSMVNWNLLFIDWKFNGFRLGKDGKISAITSLFDVFLPTDVAAGRVVTSGCGNFWQLSSGWGQRSGIVCWLPLKQFCAFQPCIPNSTFRIFDVNQ